MNSQAPRYPGLDQLRTQASTVGKEAWRKMLLHVAELHEASILPPAGPLPHPFEQIGPGYHFRAFGHWDIGHAVLDTMRAEPDYARRQLLNYFSTQLDSGIFPGVIWLGRERLGDFDPRWDANVTHPPVWVAVVQEYLDRHADEELLSAALSAASRQIRWFETHRRCEGEGFWYRDILDNRWESGIDQGIRFLTTRNDPAACVDATSHVAQLYAQAAAWAGKMGRPAAAFVNRAEDLRAFICDRLFDAETGFFHDAWSVGNPAERPMAFEGVWPVITGMATPAQAEQVIDGSILNPSRFFATHPVATVGLDDPRFELRMWRGPAWNSMTLWTARGCARYGRRDAAAGLLERALDDSARQFARTGKIWEFYHPLGGKPEDCSRKLGTDQPGPCTDYLGHNPLIAMAQMYADINADAG